MWDLPGPGIEPVSPLLEGGFFTTEPPGKPEHPLNCGYCWLSFAKKLSASVLVPFICEDLIGFIVWKPYSGLVLNSLKLSYFTLKKIFIYFNWRLITLQYCGGFCHTLTWISHGCACVPHPESPSHLPPRWTEGLSSLFGTVIFDWKIPSFVCIHGRHAFWHFHNLRCRNDYDLCVLLIWNMFLIYAFCKRMVKPWWIAPRWQPPLLFTSNPSTCCHLRCGPPAPRGQAADVPCQWNLTSVNLQVSPEGQRNCHPVFTAFHICDECTQIGFLSFSVPAFHDTDHKC